MEKIVTIVGARPQFIKVSPVSRVLRKSYKEVLVHTGQHYDHKMSGIFFEELQIPKPDYDLEVGSAHHGNQTAQMLMKIEELLLNEKPDAVLVYGDTNSTLAGALAASKLHIPLFHIEAGLRSYNKKMPEEINRVLTDHMSDLLFAPTDIAVKNLIKEGVKENVYNVGDVMYDAVLFYRELANSKYNLSTYGLEEKKYVLATIHRAENTDDYSRLKAIFESIKESNQTIVLPLHPRTEKKLKELGLYHLLEESHSLKILEPVSYLEMLFLENHAKSIVTDSGGVQKEAYFAKVPCYTLRDQTEWVETVDVGWNKLVDPTKQDLQQIIEDEHSIAYIDDLYGDGYASEKLVDHINKYFSRRS
jgi:UDP-N-acetylglucosamine 2-epimerase